MDALQQTYGELMHDTASLNKEVKRLREENDTFVKTKKSYETTIKGKDIELSEARDREKKQNKVIQKLNNRLKIGKFIVPVSAALGFVVGILITNNGR